jgi:uncharacterized membrane protein
MKNRIWNDRRIEELIGYLLITGVLLSAFIVLTGGVIYLVRHGSETPDYHTFRGEPEYLRNVRGLFSMESLHHGRGLIQLGLVLLVFTPIARVAFAMVGFSMERDWMYASISVVVLAVLVLSFTSA